MEDVRTTPEPQTPDKCVSGTEPASDRKIVEAQNKAAQECQSEGGYQ